MIRIKSELFWNERSKSCFAKTNDRGIRGKRLQCGESKSFEKSRRHKEDITLTVKRSESLLGDFSEVLYRWIFLREFSDLRLIETIGSNRPGDLLRKDRMSPHFLYSLDKNIDSLLFYETGSKKDMQRIIWIHDYDLLGQE